MLERLVGAAILIRDFAEKPLRKAKTTGVFGAEAQIEGPKWYFSSGINTFEPPSRWQIEGFVRVILDSLLLFELMRRLGDSAAGAEGSGPPVFHRESTA